MRELSKIELEIKGNDLQELGFSGEQIRKLLDIALEYKLKSPQIRKNEELSLVLGHLS